MNALEPKPTREGDVDTDRPAPPGVDVYNAETVVRTVSAEVIAQARLAMRAPRVPRVDAPPELVAPENSAGAGAPCGPAFPASSGASPGAAHRLPSGVDPEVWVSEAVRHSRRLGAAVALAATTLLVLFVWYFTSQR